MSEGTQQQRLKRLINPRKLAYSGVELCGLIPASAMPRLSEAADCSGDIRVRLAFSVDEQGKLVAKGEVEADLGYQCQRCMQRIEPRRERSEVNFGIVRNEEEAKLLPSVFDPWIVDSDEADMFFFVEDELLLTVPVVAYHDFECIDKRLLSSGDDKEYKAPEKKNPFSVLSDLKTTKTGE